MFPDLQTDPQFPGFAEDSDIASLRMEEMIFRDNDVAEHLANYPPIEIETAGGRKVWVLGRESATGTTGYGFEVVGTAAEVEVRPSVVSGMGAWAAVPEINGKKLTASPPPKLRTNGAAWVALRMEVVPAGEVVHTTNEGSSIYGVAEGAGSLEGSIKVLAYKDETAMEDGATPARIDPQSGAPAENGVYVIPLASLIEGEWQQIGYTGPLGVRMCRSGAFIALSPARAPGAEITETE